LEPSQEFEPSVADEDLVVRPAPEIAGEEVLDRLYPVPDLVRCREAERLPEVRDRMHIEKTIRERTSPGKGL